MAILGFPIITWNKPKQLEKPETSPRDKRYLLIFGGPIFLMKPLVILVDTAIPTEVEGATSKRSAKKAKGQA